MALPEAFIRAEKNMEHAQAALHAYVDSKIHDTAKHKGLVENLQRAINEFHDQLKVLARDSSMFRG